MLVHEASARFEGRAPVLADEKDRLAVVTLELYQAAVAKVTRQNCTPRHRYKLLQDLRQMDALTLEAFLHPTRARKKRRAHGR